MIINEIRPHDTIGVANWRALQSAVKQKSAATLQHSDTTKTYSEQQTIKLYRWAKLHLDRNEQHAVFDKLASAEKIAQLLPNLPLREVAASKTKYSRNEDGLKNWVELQRAVRHSSSNPSDSRHSARLSVGDQQAVLSKSDAERLFRWLKSKFRTKKERDLFEFLGSTQLLDVLSNVQTINEIDYASTLVDPVISKTEIINNSSLSGTIGSRKVFLYQRGNDKIYYFERNSDIDALVYIFKDRLLGMKNYSDNRGLIFNLLQFVINIKNKTLRLTASDKLTSEGLQWIIRQIKSKTGFNITDAQGNSIDPHELYAEWEQARTTNVHGPTEIVISKSSNSVSIKENEKRLMPMDIWGATLLHTSSNAVDVGELFETVVHIENKNETRLILNRGGLKDVMTEHQLNEIDYADALDSGVISPDNLMKSGQVIGNIEGNDVVMISKGNQTVYILQVDDRATAFVGFEGKNLKNIKNFTQTTGVVRALIGYLVHKQNMKIIISPDEPLTFDGLRWLMNLIKNPRGLVIKNQNGKDIDPTQLKQEWKLAKKTGMPSPTGITISESVQFGNKIRENEVRRNDGSLLMAFNFYSVKSKKQNVTENTDNYSDEEIERYGPELIQRQRNLDFLRSVFGYNNLHRIARALRAGNLKQRLSPAEGDSEYRSRYRRAVRILDAMTDEVGNIIPHSEDARYPKLK